MIPILINTKGRAGKTRSTALLDEAGLDYTLVVEPKEEAAYRRASSSHARIEVLPQNEIGLPLAREYARKIGEAISRRFVTVDDDVISFREIRNGKTIRAKADAIVKAAEIFDSSGLALMSLNYVQFAWSAKKKISLWSTAECCVFCDSQRIKFAHYDPNLETKEDRDFCIQVAMFGGKFGRLNSFAIEVPALGSNSSGGGLCSQYKARTDEAAAKRLLQKYGPRIITIVRKKNGRLDAKINVKPFIGE